MRLVILKKTINIVAKWFGLIFLTLLALVLISLLLLQNPKIQTKISHYVAKKLSESWDTEVSIESVNLKFFSKVEFNKFYIEDQKGDTLLYARHFITHIDRFSPLRNTYFLSGTTLDSTVFRIRRSEGDSLTNLSHIFSANPEGKATKTKKKGKSKPINLGFTDIRINDFELEIIDSTFQTYTSVKTHHFFSDFQTFNLPKRKIVSKTIQIDQPFISLNNLDKIRTKSGEEDSTTFTLPAEWFIMVNQFHLNDGQFINRGNRKVPGKEDVLSFGNFNWTDMNLDAQDLRGENNQLNFTINNLSFIDETGFNVKHFQAKGFINPDDIDLKDVLLQTPYSDIQGDVRMAYHRFANFSDFENKIELDADIEKIKLGPQDFKILFGSSPVVKPVYVSGKVKGYVSNVEVEDFELSFDNGTILKANVEARGLPDLNNTFFDGEITELKTTPNGIKEITQKESLPAQITNLGAIDFKGEFLGYLSEFVGYGDLQTDIGRITTDIKFSAKDANNPTYSGLIDAVDFDLNKWIDNPDLGKITFYASVDGQNFALNSMDTEFDATIEQVEWQQKTFSNINAKGQIAGSTLVGEIQSENELLNGQIDGEFSFGDSIKNIEFVADIARADLQKLGFFDSPFEFGGNIEANFTGQTIQDLTGSMIVDKANVLSNGKQYAFNEPLTLSISQQDEEQLVSFHSENADISFLGQYNYTQLIPTFEKTVNEYYDFEQGWENLDNTINTDKEIGFIVNINKEDQLTKLFFNDLKLNSDLSIEGSINPKTHELSLVGQADSISYGKYEIADWTVDAIGDGTILVINSFQDEISSGGKLWLKSSEVNVELSRNEILADLRTYNEDYLSAKLTTRIKRLDQAFQISFLTSELVVNGQDWEIQPGNSLTLGKGDWRAENFVLQNGEQKITITNRDAQNNVKLSADLENLSLTDLNELIKFTQKPFGGKLSGTVNLIDYENQLNLDLSLGIDSLQYNGDTVDYSTLDGLYRFDDQTLSLDGVTNDNNFQFGILAEADFKKTNDILDLRIQINKSNLKPFEHLYADAISNVQGDIEGELQFIGGPKEFRLLGAIDVTSDVYLTLKFTQARYRIPAGQQLLFVEDGFVLNQLKLLDPYNHEATINGKLKHKGLNNFTLDIQGTYNDFLFLNTTERDNDIFWGKAFASGDLTFSGPVNNALMNVNASSEDNTEIFIANAATANTGEYAFIRFLEPKVDSIAQEEKSNHVAPTNLTMDFNLEISPNAQVNIKIDEEGYNTIKGSGYGNLNIKIDTEDLFEITGIYEIYNGEYLVNFKDIFQRPFTIQPGSIIQWSGDPFLAKIDINATYTLDADLRALSESASAGGSYLANAETKINVNLGKTLLAPEFTYQIEVDKAEIGSSVGEQLAYINSNKSLLDQQIGSLLLLNQFSSVNSDPFQNQRAENIAINSVTNILTRQITTLFNESGIFKNTTIGIDYNDFRSNYNAENIDQNFGYDKNIELQLTQRFLNDRIEIELGSDFNFGDNLGNNVNAFQVGDFVFSYRLDQRGNYKFLLFSKRDYSILLNREQRRYGLGLAMQREFNSFKEFFKRDKAVKKEAKDTIDQEFPPAIDSIQNNYPEAVDSINNESSFINLR